MRRSPGVLAIDDLHDVGERFGVAEAQVRRDHAISHVLWAISNQIPDAVVFVGGTALSRTHLVRARLSDDIDLVAIGPRPEVAEQLVRALDAGLGRTIGRPRWNPALSDRSDSTPAVLEIEEDIAITVRLLDERHYALWPVERREIEQRYADAFPAELTVPTVESFAGLAAVAWRDRGAARDLWDLWALASEGHLTAEAADLFAKHGATGSSPREFVITEAPPEDVWRRELAAQTRLEVTAAEASDAVRAAWSAVLGKSWS
jgi:predicted nucleotidyltransferase component of viral defense system